MHKLVKIQTFMQSAQKITSPRRCCGAWSRPPGLGEGAREWGGGGTYVHIYIYIYILPSLWQIVGKILKSEFILSHVKSLMVFGQFVFRKKGSIAETKEHRIVDQGRLFEKQICPKPLIPHMPCNNRRTITLSQMLGL